MKKWIVLLILLLFSAQASHAEEHSFSGPMMRPGVHAGAGRTLVYQDYYAPLWSASDRVFFLDFKSVFGNRGDSEQNVGLAYRFMNARQDVIWGFNSFFDARYSENNNYLTQVGFGIELLSNPLDFRLNAYFPTTDKKLLSETDRYSFGPSNILKTTSRTYEEPLTGLDFETAYLIPVISDYVETRIRAGGYFYDSDLTKDILGYRVGLEARPSPALTFEVELKDDRTIRPQFYAGAYVTLPFDIGNLFQGKNPFEGAKEYLRWQKGTRPLKERLSDVVIRDIDIVAKDQTEAVVQDQVRRLIYVNNTNASGVENGSKDHPFNTLAEGIAASTTSGDWIYVDSGDGTATGYTGNFTLNDNTTLWGSGYQAFPGLGGGAAPTINAAGGIGISASSAGNTIQGLRVTQGTLGILALNAQSVTIRNNTVTAITGDLVNDAAGIGVYAVGAVSSAHIYNNVVSDVNTGTGGGSQGIAVYVTDPGGQMTSVVSGNIISDVEENGLLIAANNTGVLSSIVTRNVITDSNAGITLINDTLSGFISADVGGGLLGSAGYNSVYNNVLGAVFSDLGTLKAENNYWGGGAGTFAGGTVDDTPFLTSDPNL